MLRIDGTQGEGGGQVLRASISLAAVRGIPVVVEGVRARRSPPGLRAQHLTAVRALAAICHGELEGDDLGSTRVALRPREVQAGVYRFDVETAGSVALVLQAVLFPLALADGPSRVTIRGGTHVPLSPSAHYLENVFFPALGRMGIHVRVTECRPGLYPRGGGLLAVEIPGRADLVPLTAVRPEGAFHLCGTAVIAGLPRSVGECLARRVGERLAAHGWDAAVEIQHVRTREAGMALFLGATGEGVPAGFSAVGDSEESPEAMADGVAAEFYEFAQSGCGCDPYLADQVILPMALASGTSRITTSRVTAHLRTGLEVVRQLLACPIQWSGAEGQPGAVTLEGGMPHTAGPAPRGPDAGERAVRGVIRPAFAATSSPEPRAENREAKTADCESRTSNLEPRTSNRDAPVIRKAQAKDGPAIQGILAHFATRELLLPRTLNEVYKNLRDFCVAEVDGAVVGVCGLSLYWEDLAEVRSLAVLETQGGRGLGGALVEACVAEAAALGIRRVFALTYRQAFFERLGFRVIEKEELPQKIWKDCIHCAKFTCCDEIALIRETSREPLSATSHGPTTNGHPPR